jgi:GlpG protein
MRLVGTLNDPSQAERFAEYLERLGITSRLEDKPDGIEVWVHSEDRVAQAARELEEYQQNPHDQRYARPRRRRPGRKSRPTSAAAHLTPSRQRRRRHRLCAVLMLTSITVAVFSNFGKNIVPWVSWLAIMRVEPSGDTVLWNARLFADVLRGEVWRLVTPIFLHFGIMHLIFNMLWLGSLGGQVERRHGSLRFLALVIFWSAFSNACQLLLTREPLFGGMSGVNFALFCYLWLRAHYDPHSGFEMPGGTVVLMLAWFFLCLTGWLGPIANGAHIGGLVAGGLTALAVMAWRRWRSVEPRV